MTNNNATPKRSQQLDRLMGWSVALAALGLYLLTLAPTVLEADPGEFQFVPWLPGIAHPTGYPFYILLGWLWSHAFLLGQVAWRMNLLSAILAAGSVGLTYNIARQMGNMALPNTPHPGRIIAALVAAATFAVTPTFWSQAIIAEVYALHTLFVAAILWLALKFWRANCNPHSRWGHLLAFTFGLGLTHHRTTVLLLPALLLFVGRRWRQVETEAYFQRKQLITYSLLLITPLLLYLYLPLIAPFTPYTTLTLSSNQTLTLYDLSPVGFWHHVMATVFSGEIQPAAAGLERGLLTWHLLRQQVGWVGISLALAGLITLWQRQVDLLWLTGLSWLTFVAFNLIYFIGDIFVLFIPAWLLLCLWIGLGVLGLAHWLSQSFVQRKTGFSDAPAFKEMSQRLSKNIYRVLLLGLVSSGLLLPIVLLTTRINEISQKNNTSAAQRWQEILSEPIPQNAILLSNDRNEIMPMWYYQYVEGHRPDLQGLFPLIVTDPAYANVGRVLDQALASNRPVYLIKPMAGLNLKANLTPAGTLFRARAIAKAPPTHKYNARLPEISLHPTLTETISLTGYDLSPAIIKPGDQITVTLQWQTVKELTIDYTSYLHLIADNGQGLTQSDHKPGGDFYPSSYWQTGETVYDQHTLTLPANIPPGTYRLRVGMYYQPEPGHIIGMGDGLEIGPLKVSF